MPDPKPLRTPLRVALYTLASVLVLSLAAFLLFANDDPRIDPEAQGERFGRGMAPLAAISAGIAYVVQHRRRQRRQG